MASGYHIDTNLGHFALIEVVRNYTKIFKIKKKMRFKKMA